jgi:hypothetical protein
MTPVEMAQSFGVPIKTPVDDRDITAFCVLIRRNMTYHWFTRLLG